MSKAEFAHWLRRGMPPSGLPRTLRPAFAQAQGMAERFIATIDAGEHVDDDHELVDWCCWLSELGKNDQHPTWAD